MNIIHFMTALCVLTTALTATNHDTNASMIARTVKSHVKKNVDPQCYTLQRELKAKVKNEISEAKKIFLSLKSNLTTTQTEEIALLKSLTKRSHEHKTLKDLLSSTDHYLKTLIAHAEKLEDATLISTLENEVKWLKNIEKTTINAGISLTDAIAPLSAKATAVSEKHSKKKLAKAAA